MERVAAAVKGIKEIGFAVIAMTLTLTAVYAPLAFATGAPAGSLSSSRWRWPARCWSPASLR